MLKLPDDVRDVAVTGTHRSVVPVIAVMIALAGLDLVGAMFARSWADHRSVVAMVGGIVAFGLLFVVYGKSLDYVDLSTVTIGWVVLLQVGVMVLDRLDGVVISMPQLGAMGLILILQAYLTVSSLAD